ncbi:hypothetical protein [Paenibacillus sp. UMB4589-SE434]|uniref:hypothetical protein n=1 Tax=Paenibacillus sp. UMB4589-SE434 TaxID=3046314 RepID=UPI00254F0C52|nr:hypothetical protein [Paenibacillus sp. UMB4589-SE434]
MINPEPLSASISTTQPLAERDRPTALLRNSLCSSIFCVFKTSRNLTFTFLCPQYLNAIVNFMEQYWT